MNRHSLITEYDKYFKDNPTKWANKTGLRRDRLAAGIITEYINKPKRIVDVGCGNGHTLKHFGRVYPEAKLYGLDISPVACKLASLNVRRATIATGFVEDFELGFTFDLILCMGVAEHFQDIELGLRAMKRLLSKKGALYLEVPNNLNYSVGEAGYRRLSVGSRQMEWHLSRLVWEDIIRLCGFEIIRAEKGDHPAWEFVWMLK
jgi:SAM-dependent methyltransferase